MPSFSIFIHMNFDIDFGLKLPLSACKLAISLDLCRRPGRSYNQFIGLTELVLPRNKRKIPWQDIVIGKRWSSIGADRIKIWVSIYLFTLWYTLFMCCSHQWKLFFCHIAVFSRESSTACVVETLEISTIELVGIQLQKDLALRWNIHHQIG